MRKYYNTTESMNFNIIILSDEEFNIDTIESHLERKGYKCIVASKSEEVLCILKGMHEKTDLLIIQYLMFGTDIIKFIRSIRKYSDANVILLTGFESMIELAEYKDDTSIVLYAEKYHGFNDLVILLERLLGHLKKDKSNSCDN